MNDGERDEELLPSILYARFNDNSGEAQPLDHESLLLDLLSLLSTLEDIAPHFPSRDDGIDHGRDCDVVAWIFKRITQESQSTIHCDVVADINHEEKDDSLIYEWSMALKYIHDLLQHITPVELHSLASQSIILSEGQTLSHRILCLLLCTHSLQQCPLVLQKRWKRWQSLICETLRIFQDSIPILDDDNDGNVVDSGMPMFSLFVHHIVPSCLHVMDQLPFENPYHVAIFSGLVGTSSNLVQRIVGRCQEELSKGTRDNADDSIPSHFRDLLSIVYDTIRSILPSFERFGGGNFSENNMFWIEPMRQPSDTEEVHRNEDVDFWMHRDSLSWWVHHRRSHEPEERIANMDTSFHNTGLGLLAMKAFQERPMVYHPNFVWTIWCPHVVVLFSSSSAECGSLVLNSAFRFLESLIVIVPEESLVLAERTICGTPYDAHYLELFHLLSNQLMARIQKPMYIEEEAKNNDKEDPNNSFDEEAEFNIRSQRTVGLIKALLSRFTTASQVQIVEKVIQNCPTPGLQARFLDLLRPLISIPDSQTEKLLWALLTSILDEYLFKKYWNRKEQILIDIDALINRDVEISVGAVTMIQMWSLVEGKEFPEDRRTVEENLQGFRVALQKLLGRWSEDASLCPKLHYRLFLLDSALENTCESLEKK